jgi:UDP-N-acetylglucosamine 2-epimerase
LKKILSIVGARPQFVKLGPVCRALKHAGGFRHIIVHTGQHYDRNMSDFFFRDLKIPRPDHELGVGGGSHAEQTGRMMIGIEKILLKEKPDALVVFGDTNSTLAAALAAVKLHVPAVHVEAGLRSFNREMPEEHNRIVADHVCDLLLVPSVTGMDNLRKEGLASRARFTGDVMFDALRENLPVARKRSGVLGTLGLEPGAYHFATVHRPSNTDRPDVLKGLLKVFSGLDLPVVFAVHPRTRNAIRKARLSCPSDRVILTDPVGYFDALVLMSNARKVLTDSGGLQKESFYLGKHTVVLRNESEWVEIVRSGWAVLTGPDPRKIRSAVLSVPPSGRIPSCYGHGRSADRIVSCLKRYLG